MFSHTNRHKRHSLTRFAGGAMLLLLLVLAACTAAEPTPAPPAPTDTPRPERTATPEPAPMLVPSVTVADQEVVDGAVVVAEVVSNGPGWLVVHAQADGKPGPILGYSPVSDGMNTNVKVEIDLAGATETLYAMLHTDAGTVGTWEFPGGPDTPVTVDEKVVTPPFFVTGGLMAAHTPAVMVADQEIVDGAVMVAEVVSNGPGWLVIHAQADGKPGPILGYSPVNDGTNSDVKVELDLAGATETLYAMLHTDGGKVGTWEFPGGPDAPITVDEQVVTPPFKLLAAAGELQIAMEGFSFAPAVAVVKAGTAVTWVNKDNARHMATADDGLWDSGLFGKDGSFSYTFDQPGVYPYYCKPHGGPGGQGMSATVIVLP